MARARSTTDAVAVFLLATGVSVAGAGRPSFWYDEAATISASASRSLPQLARLLSHIDVVHGLYYLFMHAWFGRFPPTEFWSRVPSALAVGVAAAGVVVLAKLFCDRSVALCSGIAFALLPRVTWAGIEARPSAFSAMAAVWVSALVVLAIRRQTTLLWLAYIAAMAAAIVLDVYLVLLVPVHAAVVVAVRRDRASVLRFAVAAGTTLVVSCPFLLFARSQHSQLDWIPPLSAHTFVDVGVLQYFDHSVPFLLLAAGVVAATVLRYHHRRSRLGDGDRQLLWLVTAWIVIPTSVLLMYSAIAGPAYYPRYVCFTTPAVALALGRCVVALARTPIRMTALLLAFALAALPNYLHVQRGPYAKYGMDYSQVANVIAANARPGDCLLLDDRVTWKPGPIRPLVAARPDAYAKLVDVGLWRSAVSANTLWDTNIAPFAVAGKISRCTVVWTISQRDPTLPARQQGLALPPGPEFSAANAFWVPRQLGFRLVERWQFNFAQVIKAVR
jgi:mannosyltransferase